MFLRKELNNYGIKVDAAIKESDKVVQKAFTSQEKFKMLAESNPALLKLKELLQLEIGH